MRIPTPDGFLVGAADGLASLLQRRGTPLPSMLAFLRIAFVASIALGLALHLSQGRYLSAALWAILGVHATLLSARSVVRCRDDVRAWDGRLAATYRAMADAERTRWASRGAKALILAVAWGVVLTRFTDDLGTLSRAVAILAPMSVLTLSTYAACAYPVAVPSGETRDAGS